MPKVNMMYKNRAKSGKNNISGHNIMKLRKAMKSKPSQRMFADMLQREGLDVDKNVIQKIEAGNRFVTDLELKAIAKLLNVTCDQLVSGRLRMKKQSE